MEITLEHVLVLLLFVFLVRFIMCNCGCNRVVEGLPSPESSPESSISNLINILKASVELNDDNIVDKFKDILSGNDAYQKKLLSAMIDDLGTFCASGRQNANCSNLIDQLPGLFSKAINDFFDPKLNNQKTWKDWNKNNLLITVAANIVDAYKANAGKLCKNTGDCNNVMDNLKTQLLEVIENNITNVDVVRYCQFVPSRCKIFFDKKFPNGDDYKGNGTTSKPYLGSKVNLARKVDVGSFDSRGRYRSAGDTIIRGDYETYANSVKHGTNNDQAEFRCQQRDHGVHQQYGLAGEDCGSNHYCMGVVGDGDPNCYCMSITQQEANSGFYILKENQDGTDNYSALIVKNCAESDK